MASDQSTSTLSGQWSEIAGRQMRLLLMALVVGVFAGTSSALFLTMLERATEIQLEHGWLLWTLPIGGALFVWTQLRWGGTSPQGNLLTMKEIRTLAEGVPLRMAPFVLIGTVMTHLLGGSAGREGTALQMSASLTDAAGSRLRLPIRDRKLLLIVALSAGFGSIFGVPWAGFVFGVEVSPTSWRNRAEALTSCAIASVLGDRIVGWLGVHHGVYPHIGAVNLRLTLYVALAAPLFGLAAWLFISATDAVKSNLKKYVSIPWLAPVVGGIAVIALTLLIGNRDYNGLSLPLLSRSFDIVEMGLSVWLIKLVMTSITVGSGYAGGEVTPLFVIGATFGSAIGSATGGPSVLFAAVGMMATFGSAVNAPIACIVMGMELFGAGTVIPLAIGCGIARLCSSGRSLYHDDHVPAEAQFI